MLASAYNSSSSVGTGGATSPKPPKPPLPNIMANSTVAQEALLYGIYQKAYVPGGKLTKSQAIDLGWELAQELAKNTKSTELQTFEASFWRRPMGQCG
jgi:hypothetical protein